MSQIKYFNRYSHTHEVEKVYGEKAVEFLYKSPVGKALSPIITSKLISEIYGVMQNTTFSRIKVPKFIREFSIPIDDYKPGSSGKDEGIEYSYKSFNEFFIRKFKNDKRPFVNGNKLAAFAEARYFGYDKVSDELKIPVKGKFVEPIKMLESNEWGKIFEGGPLLIARLCPVDYHRYHYPDDGETLESYPIHGEYHSVNPLALKLKPDIFIENERRVSILKTKKFGMLAYVEVGAVCVGKIVQTHHEKKPFTRGDEKGYFLFGGSTVIVLGEKGKWSPSNDILENTIQGVETYIHLGDEVGLKI
jgi:phosphatidylserine decarboxylase